MTLLATATCLLIGHQPRTSEGVSDHGDDPGPLLLVCIRCGKEIRPL